MSGQREFTVVDVPAAHVTRLNVSEKLIQLLAAEYGGKGWRVFRIGDVLVLYSRPEEEPSPLIENHNLESTTAPDHLEHAAAQLLHVWQNGHPAAEKLYSELSHALHMYRVEKDAKEACS